MTKPRRLLDRILRGYSTSSHIPLQPMSVRPLGYGDMYPSPTTQAAWAAWLARSSVSARGEHGK